MYASVVLFSLSPLSQQFHRVVRVSRHSSVTLRPARALRLCRASRTGKSATSAPGEEIPRRTLQIQGSMSIGHCAGPGRAFWSMSGGHCAGLGRSNSAREPWRHATALGPGPMHSRVDGLTAPATQRRFACRDILEIPALQGLRRRRRRRRPESILSCRL